MILLQTNLKLKISAKYDVVGIGASPLDLLTIVDHFPTKREVQQAISTAINGGGPVGTALATLGKLGANTLMIDRIGDDIFGKFIIDDFKRYHVNTEAIQIEQNKTSPNATIIVDNNTGNRAIFFTPGDISPLEDITPFISAITQSKILHINGRHQKLLPEAIKIAKSYNTKISFDGGANRFNSFNANLAQQADICILAKDFSDKYTENTTILESLKIIIKKGATIAGITDGKNGSYLMDKNFQIYHQPAFQMNKIIDTTGCGDSYHGGFLYGLINDYAIEKSAQIASAVAAINTQKLGGRANLPSLNILKQFLLQHKIEL